MEIQVIKSLINVEQSNDEQATAHNQDQEVVDEGIIDTANESMIKIQKY